MESPAERDLIARMTRQEPEALRDFQAAYTPLLRYIIAPILPDPRDQEECLADAIHRAWERIGQFDRTGGSFSGWLSVLARNTALNHLRSQNRRPQWESLDGRGQLIASCVLARDRHRFCSHSRYLDSFLRPPKVFTRYSPPEYKHRMSAR